MLAKFAYTTPDSVVHTASQFRIIICMYTDIAQDIFLLQNDRKSY